jgi:cell division protein FtsI/penicillin-binding protein 2
MALDNVAYSVFLSPNQIQPSDRQRVATALTRILGLPPDQVAQTVNSSLKFAYIARNQGQDKATQLQDLALPGVGLEQDQQRAYMPGADPTNSLAANLLGYVNQDGKGLYGVEQYYNAELAGKPGSVSTFRDLAGNQIVLGNQKQTNAVNGTDLVLTIDSSIQLAAEKAIADGVRNNHAVSGSVLVMDPHTGAIVADADYPTFNANSYSSANPANFVDGTVSSLYEPGSVMKVATLSGAIDSGSITPQTTITDPGGVSVGGWYITDFNGGRNWGTVNYDQVLVNSLNVGAIKAEQAEGGSTFYKYLQGFGFGAPSGIDVVGEDPTAQSLAPLSQWHDSELATAAFGQGISVNMMQMLGAVNVVANGGNYVRPHVVQDVNGVPVSLPPAVQVIKPDTAKQMTQMMTDVVQQGAARLTTKVPGFDNEIAGKTGTSQMPEGKGYSDTHVWASFVGFMPTANPRFIALVLIRQPDNGNWDANDGYYAAGPVWKSIAQQIVVRWGITP